MKFQTELQGKTSHEALLRLQDAEIQLLELMKRWIGVKVKCERDYATAVTAMINNAKKSFNTEYNTPIIQVWSCLVQETEKIIVKVRENADAICAKTLESVVHLINEKKASKKLYIEERQRIDNEFSKVQTEVEKQKIEYEKCVTKVVQDKAKYEDLKSKGKPGSKVEDAKLKYHKSTVKLHKVHNDYVTAIYEASLHQHAYTNTTLPGLLEYQQNIQETLASQCKDVLLEYARLTDGSSEDVSKSYREINKNIKNLDSRMEYNQFMEKHGSSQEDQKQFAFESNLLDDYKGNLQPNVIAMDDLTYEALSHSQTQYEEYIQVYKNRCDNKETEKRAVETDKNKLQTNSEDTDKLDLYNKNKLLWSLKRETDDIRCQESKYKSLYDMVHQLIDSVGDGDPPRALNLDDMSPTDTSGAGVIISDNDSSGGSLTSGTGKAGKFGAISGKLGGLFNKNKPPDLPPTPAPDYKDKKDNTASRPPPTVKPKPPPKSYEPCEVGSAKSDPVKNKTSNRKGSQPRQLENEDWFHGVLPRDEVQRLLVNDGDFLVRESRQKRTGTMQYVLSVFWSGHKHFIIQGVNGAWQFEGPTFPTIPELVDHQLQLGTAVTHKSQAILRKPIAREEWELKNDDIEVKDKIGAGNFGDVFRGMYKPKKLEIAIKTCKETLSEEQKKKFLMEGRILKQYDHPNIVKFVGIAAHRNPVMIVMEFVSGGALSTFLRRNGIRLKKKELVKMCEDAAAGMSYLSDSGCIHRDLAARNCLVGKDNIVKISDFGMSREEEEYTVSDGMKQIPIKWTAPEALNYGRYTAMCDVWSFGILMWEVFSNGQTPYQGMSNNMARDEIDRGYRMPAPEGTPPDAYDWMRKCWEYDSENRPAFKDIHESLMKIRRTCKS